MSHKVYILHRTLNVMQPPKDEIYRHIETIENNGRFYHLDQAEAIYVHLADTQTPLVSATCPQSARPPINQDNAQE